MAEMSLADKKKILQNLVKKTQKDHGGATHVLSFAADRAEELKYTFIQTPSENLNSALNGGFARGKIIEVAGESGSGKTSLLLETIGQDQKDDPEGIWGWLDTEGDFDKEYAEQKGVDLDRLLIWEVDDVGAESGLDTLEMLIRSNSLKAIVVNSVSGLTPKTELEAGMGDQQVALQARMMSKLMRKITAISNRTKTSVIFINQLRVNVGQKYGDPNTTTGGKALAFFATQRVFLNKVKVQKEDGITEEEGIKVSVRIKKNRAAYDNPYKVTSYTALFGEGIDKVRELLALAQEYGIATSGSWIYVGGTDKNTTMDWKGEKVAINGKAKFLEFMKADPEFQEFLLEEIRKKRTHKIMSNDEIQAIESEEKELELAFGEE